MESLVLATRNAHKAGEIRSLLAGLPLRLLTLDEAGVGGELEEDGETFEENASAKAGQACAAAGLPALADDSGIEVDALGGQPGVRSARYAGAGATDAANNARLLAEVRAAGATAPAARFRCVAALRLPPGAPLLERLLDAGGLPPPGDRGPPPEVELDGLGVTVSGSVEGTLLAAPRGGRGFGYDPLFLLPDGRSMAELDPLEKNAISHRGRAFRRMRPILEGLFAAGRSGR